MSENYTVGKDMVVGLAYTLFVDNAIEDNAPESAPLVYLQGHGNLISGLERALEGAKVGEKLSVTVSPEEAYGEYDEEAILPLERGLFPEDYPLAPGNPVTLLDEHDNQHTGYIVDATEKTVRVDMNHPMAGKTLVFECVIVSLRPATPEEIEAGSLTHDDGCCSDCSSCGHHCHD